MFLKYYDILNNCFTLSNDHCIFLISILFILLFHYNKCQGFHKDIHLQLCKNKLYKLGSTKQVVISEFTVVYRRSSKMRNLLIMSMMAVCVALAYAGKKEVLMCLVLINVWRCLSKNEIIFIKIKALFTTWLTFFSHKKNIQITASFHQEERFGSIKLIEHRHFYY